MSTLTEQLAQVDRQKVVRDTTKLIDNEVDKKSGISGFAIKAGYKAVKGLRNGQMIELATDNLLDAFTEALDPLYQDYRAGNGAEDFSTYLRNHSDEAVQALLGVTDDRIDNSDRKLIRKTYYKLRKKAEPHVEEALPGVGDLIDKHTTADQTGEGDG